MKRKIVNQEFFQGNAEVVAQKLLGKIICRKIGKKVIKAIITETEAYLGERDLASHARFGKTKRNSVMYGPAGHWYVYFVYGMHWLLNVVTGPGGNPAAVLFRAAIMPARNLSVKGPAVLTKKFKIDGKLNGRGASKRTGLWMEDWGIKAKKIVRSKRIGVDYAGKWADKKLRFNWYPKEYIIKQWQKEKWSK